MFVYQIKFNILKLKNNKSTECIINWKSKGICNFKLKALHGAFLPKVKHFRKKIGMQFNSTPLFIKQNSYTTKFVNVYIVYTNNI